MSHIVLRTDLLIQRDLMLEAYPSIEDAIRDETFELPEPDEPMLLISDHGKLFEFNLVAAFIWEKLQAGLSNERIIDSLQRSFEVTAQVAERDLDGFVRFLRHISLIDVASSTTATGAEP